MLDVTRPEDHPITVEARRRSKVQHLKNKLSEARAVICLYCHVVNDYGDAECGECEWQREKEDTP